MRKTVIATLVLAAACGDGEPEAGRPDAPAADGVDTERRAEPSDTDLVVRLVDSIPWDNQLAAGVYRRVEVRHAGGVDTIPGVEVAERPRVRDGAVWGFDRSDGDVERGFRWTPAEGVESIEPPADFVGFVTFGLSPGADRLAYVAGAAEGFRPKVVAWPSKDVLYLGPAIPGYPSDDQNSSVDWPGIDRVDIRIRTPDLDTPGGSWLRASGDPAGEMRVDTVIGGG
ncbi:MAG TPA: hypothetical protein VM778_14225 [Gemmatimonadota bacterium]|nr:hypothetical protein [Gemmatimonadota bacterium]